MVNCNITLTNSFADGTTRKFKLEPFAIDATAVSPATIKSNIRTINNNISELENLYLSDNGAKFTGISGAELTANEETIYI